MSQATATHSHLFFAQDLLRLRAKQPANQHSLSSAAWLSLREAWQCWLAELGALLTPKGEGKYDTTSLADLIASVGEGHPEMQRLINLRSTPSSWLSVMLRAFEKPGFALPAKVDRVEVPEDPRLIPLNALDASIEEMPVDAIAAAFKDYTKEVRAHLTEW